MKKTLLAFAALLLPETAFAALPDMTGNHLLDGVLSTVLYGFLGIIMAFIGVKVIDKATPGDLGKQLGEEKNVALAIVVGAFVLGVCIIIAAAIAG